MAKTPAAPTPAAPTPFPKNWARMSREEKNAWQVANRPGFDPAARAAAPLPVPAPAVPAEPEPEPEPIYDDIAPMMPNGEQPPAWQEGEESRVRAVVAKILREMAERLAGGNTGL